MLIEVKEREKISLLKDVTVVENPDSCIIFCRTKEHVNTVFTELEEANYSCERLHGGLEQEDRFAVMDGFKMGNFRYLMATDVAARGIDIDNVSLVINYDVPMEKESYVHRTGRTGRAGNKGKAITFATPYEGKFLRAIERYIGFEIPAMEAPNAREVAAGKALSKKKLVVAELLEIIKRLESTKISLNSISTAEKTKRFELSILLERLQKSLE